MLYSFTRKFELFFVFSQFFDFLRPVWYNLHIIGWKIHGIFHPHNISDGYEDVFENFCQHLEEMREDKVDIVLDQFLGIEEKSLYTFHCQMVTFEEKRPIMVGVIVQNSPDKDQSLLMGLDYSKDPNTDISFFDS